MKDVLINCYEGNLLFKNVPNNEKRSDIIERARIELNKDRQRKLTGLNNIDYIANPSYTDLEELEDFLIKIEY
ncbi:hypothetical protein [Clostridium sp. M14]|uniref:hypothetical protein n=1 Tax=Clostridium sp. M14 TaxID=2716311 RepID=UPI0013EEA0C3|nr:hypothetical protein [Clostridium sp. M14]MBZ9693375.1 hypothetical protein [Clostridium sp. M14]